MHLLVHRAVVLNHEHADLLLFICKGLSKRGVVEDVGDLGVATAVDQSQSTDRGASDACVVQQRVTVFVADD